MIDLDKSKVGDFIPADMFPDEDVEQECSHPICCRHKHDSGQHMDMYDIRPDLPPGMWQVAKVMPFNEGWI